MKKIIALTGLFITIIGLSYFESPYSVVNKDIVRTAMIPNEILYTSNEEEAIAAAADESEEVEALNYTLEMVLEDTTEDDGYVVETYREYEVYKDEKGKITKKVPTENYNYIRYYE